MKRKRITSEDALYSCKKSKVEYFHHINDDSHSTSIGRAVSKEHGANISAKSDSVQLAEVVLKEAIGLKQCAGRLENGESDVDWMSLYFQAALKFLYAASLLEPTNVESANLGKITRSMKLYIDAATLFKYCALEFHKRKQMTVAALAYKCIEVAYMRVIYSNHHEIQSVLHGNPLGESPSASTSCLDDLNSQASQGCFASLKCDDSTQTAGNLIISPDNHFTMQRLFKYMKHMDFAKEALGKSHCALAAATANINAEKSKEGLHAISCVKGVLDFSYYNVEGFMRLVRLALEAIGD